MKIITKTTFVLEPDKTVPPGTVVDIEKQEALSLIARGLAELPEKDKAAADKAAAEAAAKSAPEESANGAGGGE